MLRVLLTGVVFFSSVLNAAVVLQEGFDNVAGLVGWTQINNSNPLGTTGWFQGNPGSSFDAQSGPANSYIAANFENADFAGNISNWLITPVINLQNGDTLTFWTRSTGILEDRLEVRLNASGTLNVGVTDASVGDFTTLLDTVNPLLDGNYPSAGWAEFTVVISGLASPTNATLAFRYFVPDTETNGDYIGIDSVTIDSTAIPEPSTLLLISSAVLAGLVRRRRVS